MDLTRVCTNCFKLKSLKTPVCPYCGKTGAPDPVEAYHLYPGTVLNSRYLLGEVLGFGGFGIIYKALDLKLGRVIAIKEYFPGSLVCRTPGEKNVSIFSGDKSEEFKKGFNRFLEEARNMANFMNEPYIVNVYEYFTENRTAYIVMEYLNGISLEEYIKKSGGKLSVEEAMTIIDPVLRGLKVLHDRSVIHRDINPRNILITADNKIKIIDFGTARFVEENERTRTNVVSDGYAPPEQYKTKSIEGPYTDIYAVGATLYRMITGKTPTPVLERAMNDTMVTPMKVVSDVPGYVDVAIMKAMAIKPKLRFQSVDELVSALTSPDKNIDYPEIEERRRTIRRNVSVISALVAVVAIVVGLIFVTQKKDNLYQSVKGDIAKSESIVAYVPYEDSEDKKALEQVYDEISENFYDYANKQFGKKITLETVFVQKDDYAQRVISDIEDGQSVNLFRSDLVDSATVEKASLKPVVDELGDNIQLLEQYHEIYGTSYDSLPLGFYVYLQYADSPDNKGLSGVDSWSGLSQRNPELNSLVVSPDGLEALYGSLKNEGATYNLATDIFERAYVGGKMMDYDTAIEQFTSKKAAYYIGTSKDMKTIRKSDLVLSYSQENLFSNENKWYGSFDQVWSISAKGTKSSQSAAMLYLRYCLSDEAQQILALDNQCSQLTLSLNKNIYNSQLEYHKALSNLPSVDSIIIYSEKSKEKVFAKGLAEWTDSVEAFVKDNY